MGEDEKVDAENRYVVTFVCSGNICRSPIAEFVVADLLEQEGIADRVRVDSAGIGAWHVGHQADPRALTVLKEHGVDGSRHRARQLDGGELATADLLVAMDAGHAEALRRYAGREEDRAKVQLMRSFDPAADPDDLDLADPYYGDDAGFSTTLEQVLAAAPGLVAYVRDAVTTP
jgi:protein-tyrosine phosphatase